LTSKVKVRIFVVLINQKEKIMAHTEVFTLAKYEMPFKKASYELLNMEKQGIISLADKAKVLLQELAFCVEEQYETLCLKIEALDWVFEEKAKYRWSMFRVGGVVWIKWVNE
jgi:hypothetical protein